MARYQLILAFDGTDFSGFQRSGETRTVQKVIETALQGLGWQEDTILFAGRTDAGVHASGQVVVFSLDWQHEDNILVNALNATLPSDVSVQRLSRVDAEFHPRYDALTRSYAYTIYHLPERDPLRERFAWRIWPPLDGLLLNQAAEVFLGRFNFSAFGRALKLGSNTVREVTESQWFPMEQGWRYQISANAFLYHMVRRLVYYQVQVANGLLTVENLKGGLSGTEVMKPGIAPPNGLVLTNVVYGEHRTRINKKLEINSLNK
jgi:tRNA pseudouridine38-40 synthase